MRRNKNPITNYTELTIWKLNRKNQEITQELILEDRQLSQLKRQHQQLVKELSELDQIIRAREKFIKYQEQRIIDNTTQIQNLKSLYDEL